MGNLSEEIRVPAEMGYLRELLAFVASCAERSGFGQTRLREIELVMEEILVNIFNYAYPDRKGDVGIACRSADDGKLLVEITDQGIPFDILSLNDPDLQAGIEERNIGGLGVFFVKQLIRDIRYRRESGRNILTLTIDPTPAVL
ncbi:MAG: ATP-binding protein, partial [Smithellaceae bacterium]|nr:ATP-binding protein [Smithellaceae bacterium]